MGLAGSGFRAPLRTQTLTVIQQARPVRTRCQLAVRPAYLHSGPLAGQCDHRLHSQLRRLRPAVTHPAVAEPWSGGRPCPLKTLKGNELGGSSEQDPLCSSSSGSWWWAAPGDPKPQCPSQCRPRGDAPRSPLDSPPFPVHPPDTARLSAHCAGHPGDSDGLGEPTLQTGLRVRTASWGR